STCLGPALESKHDQRSGPDEARHDLRLRRKFVTCAAQREKLRRAIDAMHAISSEKTLEERTRHILSEIFANCSLEKIGVRLWDSTAWPDERPRNAMLVLRHPGALGRMFLPGTEVGLAEAYLHDDFDIEGDIEATFEISDFLLSRLDDWKKKLKLGGLLVALPGRDAASTM